MRSLVADMQFRIFSLPVPENTSLRRIMPPAIKRLEEIHIPVLIVSGGQDVRSMVELAATFARRATRARHVIIPGAAHMVSMEAPHAFNQAVSDFMATLPD